MRITIRFYEELNDFIKDYPHKRDITFNVKDRRTVKDLIESQFGVPHVEVDLILVNGVSVGFDYVVKEGDRISVYPMFERLDIQEVARLGKGPLRDVRFVLDGHLGKLAKYLMLMGFDVDYKNDRDDVELAAISQDEKRILLTRDRRLLMRKNVDHGLIVRHSDPMKQIVEILNRLHLWQSIDPFSRCLCCSGELIAFDKNTALFKELKKHIPEGVLEWCYSYKVCSECGRIYWEGSHKEHMKKTVAEIMHYKP